MVYDLSILIPARNEMFLARTIENILENIKGRTEVIAVLDGAWADPGIRQHEHVTVLYLPESVGQRAATNIAAKLSKAKYVMKVDAHCAFDKGFDVKMMDEMQDDWTMVPTMYNLHAFDWVCDGCGNRWYQGPTPEHCFKDYKAQVKNDKCNSRSFHKEVTWTAKTSPRSNFYRFDNTLHFQYWKDYEKRPEAQGDIAETLSIQGSCFMLTREKYWELDICSEDFHSWGQQGVEVSCKTWLSGGRLVVNKKTWYAHLFRTQGKDFGFPYPNPGSQVRENREKSRDLFMNNKWNKAIYPFQWLIDKFAPVPGWDSSIGILYYTDSEVDDEIGEPVRRQLKRCAKQKGARIVSVSLRPLQWGDNITLPLKRGYITMTKQILAGLKELETDYVFFCEHDVIYHPSHFDFRPKDNNTYYYNTNVWRVRYSDGYAVRTDDCRQLSGLCAARETLIKHYEKRLSLLEAYTQEYGEDSVEFRRYVRKMGFEPGTHGRAERVDNLKSDKWESEYPNVDIREHGSNLTPSKWSPEEYRNQKYARGWQETTNIPGWGSFSYLWRRKV